MSAQGSHDYSYDGSTTVGYNITSSEMGHLFYSELGNKGEFGTSGNRLGYPCGGSPCNLGPFQNLLTNVYWSDTTTIPPSRYSFNFARGEQIRDLPESEWNYGIAVHAGRVVVPEPISSILFIVGGATLGFRIYRKRRNAN